uniref:Putative ovule protein n=1 Tax=Solanum chacoense TaxID=4108 RepID=A0A0V0H301_SOLCH
MGLGIGSTTEDEGTIQGGIVLRFSGETGCLTHDNLIKRGLRLCSKCLLCGKDSERISYLFYIVR